MLPAEVLSRAGDEMLDWRGSGMGVMEMSHRGKEFISIDEEAERDLRELLAIPANYKVLFLQGGATLQFAQMPDEPAARQGQGRLRRHRRVVEEGDQGSEGLLRRPHRRFLRGQEFHVRAEELERQERRGLRSLLLERDDRRGRISLDASEESTIPLVADASSHFLSRPMDVSKFGLIYAGAQKNAGPAGLTFVIVRDDLIGQAAKGTPSRDGLQGAGRRRLDAEHAAPTYSIYVAGLVFKWLKQQGGLAAIEKRNIAEGEAALRLSRLAASSSATRWRRKTARG